MLQSLRGANSHDFGAELDFDYTTVVPLDCLNIAFTDLHKRIRFQFPTASYCSIVSTKEFWIVGINLRRSSGLDTLNYCNSAKSLKPFMLGRSPKNNIKCVTPKLAYCRILRVHSSGVPMKATFLKSLRETLFGFRRETSSSSSFRPDAMNI